MRGDSLLIELRQVRLDMRGISPKLSSYQRLALREKEILEALKVEQVDDPLLILGRIISPRIEVNYFKKRIFMNKGTKERHINGLINQIENVKKNPPSKKPKRCKYASCEKRIYMMRSRRFCEEHWKERFDRHAQKTLMANGPVS